MSVKEIRYFPLYDYRRGLRNVTGLTFFQFPVGTHSRPEVGILDTRTHADTNMYIPCSLPAGVEYYAHALKFYTTAKGEERENLLDGGYVEFRVGSRIMFSDAPVRKFPALIDAYPWDPLIRDPSLISHYEKGLRELTQRITPVYIRPHEHFEVRVHWSDKPIPVSPKICIGFIIEGYWMIEAP